MKLDIGCGRKKERGFLGIDIESAKGVDIVCSAENLPFKTGSVTEVFTQECIIEAEYVGNAQQAISEIERVLRKGGKLTYNCWTSEPYRKLISLKKTGRAGYYRPTWDPAGEVPPRTFRSFTYTK